MTTLCERYSVTGACGSLPRTDLNGDEPPKAGELFKEAGVAVAIPLAVAALVTLALPLAGFAAP